MLLLHQGQQLASVKNLAMRLLKDFRLRLRDDEESQFDGEVKRGRGRRQCGIHATVAMATAPRTKKLGAFVNGNDENMIWDAMLNEMVQRYPQVAAGAPPPPNAPANNDVGIAPPARGTNDAISFIIDHLNADEEDADEETEEGTTPLIDQYR